MKIGPVDPEIILLKLKKEEINASKIYSLFAKFAERAKLHMFSRRQKKASDLCLLMTE